MNILIPDSWLREYLDTDATPQEIQQYLSLCGPSVERMYEREGESVYDIEITTNRVDSMSVMGVAREAAVILKQFGKKAEFKMGHSGEKALPTSENTSSLPLPKIVNDPKLNKRTLCMILADVARNPTPEWMAKRLRQVDMNVHDVVIDITNYVTHELGHPCHAFDYDQIMRLGGEIKVAEAKKGQKMTTLDGEEYLTVGGEVVFVNPAGEIIDLPSIKGTANTSISANTKNVLFFIESTMADKVRFASMTHAIRTVAAQLLEKNVDPELALPTFIYGVELFRDLAGAKIASELYDDYPGKITLPSVSVPLSRISDYLGITIPTQQIISILTDLGCEVKLDGQSLIVTPPSFRSELNISAEIIEEVARVYGYHNLPSRIMDTPIPVIKPTHTNFVIENRIKRFLAAIGWQEVYTYSMVGSEIAEQSGYKIDEHLKLQNPLTEDRVYLRRSLVPSLEELISSNQGATAQPLHDVFEIANTYLPQKNQLPGEELHLTLVSKRPLTDVRGDLEVLWDQLFIKNIVVTPDDITTPELQQSATISLKDNQSEVIGKLGISRIGCVVVDLKVSILVSKAQTHPTYQPIPKTSLIIEDLTFTLPASTAVGPVLESISQLSAYIYKVGVKNVYKDNVTFCLTYHDPDKNIENEDVSPIRKSVVEEITNKWSGQLVGQI